MSWYSGLEAIVRPDVPLAEYTWYGLGGPARWLVTPRDENDLGAVLRRCREAGVAWYVLGAGANLLVRDAGVDGAVLQLRGPNWEAVRFEDPLVHAGGGADFTKVVKRSVERGLHGLETLAGIPGTVGGVVRMNAGGKYGSVAQYIRSVRLVRDDGALEVRSAEEMGFGYRQSRVNHAVVTGATFVLTPGDVEAGLARFRTIWNEKAASQPAVSAKSCGCIFRNPPGHAAGRLIDEAGLKGARHGGAEISTRHANFIVAYEGATAADVLALLELARQRVLERTGIALHPEVEIW